MYIIMSHCYTTLYITRGETYALSSLPGMYSLLVPYSDVPVTITLVTVLGQAIMNIVIPRGPRVCLSIAGGAIPGLDNIVYGIPSNIHESIFIVIRSRQDVGCHQCIPFNIRNYNYLTVKGNLVNDNTCHEKIPTTN